MHQTLEQYRAEQEKCRQIFLRKNQDYGQSWRFFRATSLTDQMLIKAKRIRQLEVEQTSEINEGIEVEYQGLVNYGIMALIQESKSSLSNQIMDEKTLFEQYDLQFDHAQNLMLKKNKDYGEAWRDLRLSSITDLIIVKLDRIRTIEESGGKTKFSEGIKSNYLDIINYAIFALIILNEKGLT